MSIYVTSARCVNQVCQYETLFASCFDSKIYYRSRIIVAKGLGERCENLQVQPVIVFVKVCQKAKSTFYILCKLARELREEAWSTVILDVCTALWQCSCCLVSNALLKPILE